MNLQKQVSQTFAKRFGEQPSWLIRAPGRVNLIGEHTDYNDGFVLPMAINRAVWIALRRRTDQHVSVFSLDMMETATFDLDNLERNQPDWVEYVKGVAWALKKEGHALTGWDGVMGGDVPIGAGLSSSAAVEMAAVRAFYALAGETWMPEVAARIGQQAENHWMGVESGIMDQMASAAGRSGHALFIDCRTLQVESVPMPTGAAVIVLDTGTRRGLVDSEYNERRAQCRTAAARFGVTALRDIDVEEFRSWAGILDQITRRRARHVISENARVLAAREALRNGDVVRFGNLMTESHVSLRDDFEVTSPALNAIVDASSIHPKCFGARMTGAGFGGCAVAFVEKESANDFVAAVTRRYQKATGHQPSIYICEPAAGAEAIALHGSQP